MGKGKYGLFVVATGALFALGACAESVPQQIAYGYQPGYERGIDQDISATHNGDSATFGNLIPGPAAPWRLTQY